MDRILLISLLAGLCTTVGAGTLFLKKKWSNKSLGFFLGLAAGVMGTVVLLDMLPSAFLFSGYKLALSGIIGGAGFVWFFNQVILKNQLSSESLVGLGYLIMLGIAMHDFPEGMAIAMGDEMKGRTGMIIALAIGIHNIPEGMAIAAPLIMGRVRKLVILVQTALIGLITPLGTVSGKYLLILFPHLLPLLLGLASGIMIYLVLSQLWPQARSKNKASSIWGLIIGILIITVANFI